MVFEKSQLLEAAVMWHQKGVPVIPFTLTWNEKKQEYEKRPAWKRGSNGKIDLNQNKNLTQFKIEGL